MTNNDNRLSGLDFKQDNQNVQPYSRFIKSLQFILPIGILLVVGLLVLWPQLSKIETSPLTEKDVKALKRAKTENTLIKPTFNTVDSKGNPVEISATNARQSKAEKNTITLENPSAKMNDNGRILQFEAQSGLYDQSNKILLLRDGVKLQDSQNNTLETESLTADIKNNIAKSDSPVTLTTDQGVIEGQSVIIDQEKQTTIFQGPAKAVINP